MPGELFLHDGERRCERVLEAYRRLFSHPEAGTVLADLADAGELFRPSFRNANPEGTAYGEGKRSIVLRILQFSGYEESIRNLFGKEPDR